MRSIVRARTTILPLWALHLIQQKVPACKGEGTYIIIFPRRLADLRVKRFEIGRVRWRLRLTNCVPGSGHQLLLRIGDLGGMHIELVGQFDQRTVAFDHGRRHLRLEGRSVIPSPSLHCLAPLVRHHAVASVRPGSQLSRCPNYRIPL